MIAQVIKIADLNDPIELNAWLSANPNITLKWVLIETNLIYIFYE